MIRLLGGVILLVVMALPVILGPAWVLLALAHVIVLVCLFELFRVMLAESARTLGWIVLAGSIPIMWLLYYGLFLPVLCAVALTALAVIIAGLLHFEHRTASGIEVALALSGLIYPTLLIGFWILVRNDIDGRFWMIFGLISTFCSDIGAYYVGKNLGRRTLAPRLSPKKTMEGLVGGVAFSMLCATAFGLIFMHCQPLSAPVARAWLPLMAAAIALLGLAGDLTASMFKREFNVKDLGQLIPGHGGMLDRMDGVVPVGAALYIFLQVIR